MQPPVFADCQSKCKGGLQFSFCLSLGGNIYTGGNRTRALLFTSLLKERESIQKVKQAETIFLNVIIQPSKILLGALPCGPYRRYSATLAKTGLEPATSEL